MSGDHVRLLITGGAGFIGSNLARAALAAGHRVAVIDDLSTGYEQNLEDLDLDFVRGSILDPAAMATALQNVHSVVHLAALGSVPRSIEAPFASHAANATGTLSVLEAARAQGVSHTIVASSSSVYGLNPARPKGEREWVRPMSPYAVTKLATEQYALAYQESFGMRSIAFRFFNVYGPRQRAGHVYAAVIPTFIDALLSGKALNVYGDGTQSRDFTFVGTVCSILLDAAERRVSHPEPVNLAFGTNTRLLDLIATLEKLTGASPDVLFNQPRPGDVKHSQAKNDVLRTIFSTVSPVSLEHGLTQTIAWFKEPQ